MVPVRDGARRSLMGFPFWIRVTRQGNDFAATYSNDGAMWREGTDGAPARLTIPMGKDILVGVAVAGGAAPVEVAFESLAVQRP
jgi:regulation of enolase protein 1 (concanavalin A-like superfamily)